MTVLDKPLNFYTDKIRNNEYFSQGMYGDGEWIAIFHERVNLGNAENTIYTKELCDDLERSLYFKADNFFFSSPAVLATKEVFGPNKIRNFLRYRNINIDFYEKDMWDKAMKSGELSSFIELLYEKPVVYISNKSLSKLDFIDHFIEIPYPNCYDHRQRIKQEILDYGKPAIYLFSCGLPAAIFVQDVHDQIPESFFLDIGSIFDTFVGIGAQRGWRAELYADPDKYKQWKCLYPRWPISTQS